MLSENDIINKLHTLLSAVSGIEAVYKGIPDTIATYPAITIIPVSWEEEYRDLRDTIVNSVFQIGVYVQTTTDTITAQSLLRGLIDDVRNVLGDNDNITLDGLVDSSRLTSGQYLADQKESDIYYCLINYNVRKAYSRFA